MTMKNVLFFFVFVFSVRLSLTESDLLQFLLVFVFLEGLPLLFYVSISDIAPASFRTPQ